MAKKIGTRLCIGARLGIEVTDNDIMESDCLDPHKCMGRLGVYRKFTQELHRDVESLRLRGNGVTATMRLPDGSRETEWWAVPTRAFNKICLFDEADAAIKANPEKKRAILRAIGVRPFKFSIVLIQRKMTKPASPERQAQIEENRRKRIAYWQRREKKEPGITPRGYFSGVRRRYQSTIMQPRAEVVAAALAEGMRVE